VPLPGDEGGITSCHGAHEQGPVAGTDGPRPLVEHLLLLGVRPLAAVVVGDPGGGAADTGEESDDDQDDAQEPAAPPSRDRL